MSDSASPPNNPQTPSAPAGLPPTDKTTKPFYKRKIVWLLAAIILIIAIYAVNNPRPYSSAPAATDAGSSAPAIAAAAASEPSGG
jgi:hypothetical protein